MSILLYLKWITNKDLLYSTGKSAQCYMVALMGGKFGGEWIQGYVWLSPIAVPLKLSHIVNQLCAVLCYAKVLQSCLTLCDHMDSSPPGSSVRGDSPGNNTVVGCHALLQGIFLTQGSNLHL